MNPLHLTARNYRSFETLDVDLPDGCVAVLGENGAGKSSIVNAVDLAIFGPESRSLADTITEGVVDEELLLALEFEHAGELYRVRRAYSPRGRGKTTLDFDRRVRLQPYQDWTPLTCESSKATQELIEQTIGLSRETFRASAFLSQGDGAAFTEAQPRDRKRILAEVLGLEQWTVLAERARADRRLLETRAAALTGRTAQAVEQASALPELEQQHADTLEAETVAADNVADLERSHGELAVQYQAAREHASRRAAAEAELKTAEGELATLTARSQDALKAAHSRVELAAEIVKLPAAGGAIEMLEAKAAGHTATIEAHRLAVVARDGILSAIRDAQQRRDALLARAQEARAKADEIRAAFEKLESTPVDEATCDRCRQHLGVEGREAARASLLNEASGHADTYRILAFDAAEIVIPEAPAELEEPLRARESLELTNDLLAKTRAAVAQRAVLEERIRQCEQVAGNGPAPDIMLAANETFLAKQARIAAIGDPADVAAITAQGNLVAELLRTARTSLDQHKTQRARLDERITVAKTAAASLVAAADERKELDESLRVVAALEHAFSPDGVPALIVENSAIPYLETEANRILVELGTSFRVELRTQAALKSGDGLRDTLDVIVCSEKGERPYETFSGGERTRINLALRIALARLLAHRRGAESRLLVVDEPDGLDDAGMSALVGVLRSLEGDFDKLYIVSHVPGLRDSFDTTLSVVNDEHGSRVVEAGVFDAVAA